MLILAKRAPRATILWSSDQQVASNHLTAHGDLLSRSEFLGSNMLTSFSSAREQEGGFCTQAAILGKSPQLRRALRDYWQAREPYENKVVMGGIVGESRGTIDI